MKGKFVILCCENIRPEVDAVLATGAMPHAIARSFPFHCGHVQSAWNTIRDPFSELEAAGAAICLCGCGCANTLDIPEEVLTKNSLTLVESGALLFLPETLVGDYLRNGAMLLLPGMLLTWKQSAEYNRLDPSTAKEMYKESVTEIILLDTGVHADLDPVLAGVAGFTGLPARRIPVGIKHFRLLLLEQYLKWQCEEELTGYKSSIRASEKRVADYSMVADLTGKIIGIHDEQTIIRQTLELVTLLSSPKRAGFLTVREDMTGTIISFPPDAYTSPVHFQRIFGHAHPYLVNESGDGFLFPVKYHNDLIGILAVDQVSIPESLDEYLNLTHFISQIAGLSITIARTHADLLLAMKARETEIAERIRVELALRESEERYRGIIENIQDVFFRFDGNNRLVMTSPSAARTFGYDSVGEMLGLSAISIWKNPDERPLMLEAMEQQGGAVQDWEAKLVKRDGTVFWASVNAHLHTDELGGYQGTEGIIRDISERKKIEEALKGAVKKLNMLSSITRHDILNQITGLRTYLELSKEDLKGTPFEEFVDKEDQAAEAIQRQIEFTKYYQDIGVNAPKWQDAAGVIKDAVAQLNLPAIRVEVTVDGVEIFADPLIVKVFFNLMENSLRHGERVTAMDFSSRESEAGLVLTYRDNGVGISAEDKQKLFRKGFGKHTGLGLFLSREILAITGITITENGEPGAGVRFEITMPKEGYRYTS